MILDCGARPPSAIVPKFAGGEIASEGAAGGEGEAIALNTSSPEPVAYTPAVFKTPSDAAITLAASVSWMLATTPADIAFLY
jgi:hypothetical protein